MGETSRVFVIRPNEHKKEAEQIAKRKYTCATRKDSLDEVHKSAISDNVAQQNLIIDWEGAKVIDRDSNKQTRWIREAIWIRKRGAQVINHDEGTYSLSHVYDQLLQVKTSHSGDESKQPSRGNAVARLLHYWWNLPIWKMKHLKRDNILDCKAKITSRFLLPVLMNLFQEMIFHFQWFSEWYFLGNHKFTYHFKKN